MSEIKNIFHIALAIKKINPDHLYKGYTDIDHIDWNEGVTPIPKEDILEKIKEVEADEQAEKDKKASGKQKLKDLGLDDAEIKALTGA